ncbi:MAG: hypothetical protein DIZ80_04080 [endosymbiont of Galathealinum brachiosum]|uniref:histidine kinase n=1 Tax=endosymbiont of Galathealinum brachiosum TaxID=2200906 RepID=A0A370DKI1_9GAMM|nr:MAG: hypothetical protein DIZ80_04080 [endosymbiont of Galathealinum brachiosum]
MKNIGRRFLLLFILTVAVFVLILGYFYLSEVNKKKSVLEANEILQVKLGKQFFEKELETTVSDLRILSQHNAYDVIGTPHNSDIWENLAQEFIVFAHNKPYYDQIRFLDETGREVIRVNSASGSPYIVAQDQLQDKSQRYYFTDTLRLKQGEIFISPFDLNIEHGKVEVPFKPIIRFATPVLYGPEKKRGVILLNYLGLNLLQALKEPVAGNKDNTMLLNADGYWLHTHLKELEWGFMLENDHTIHEHFPEAWKQITNADEGHFYNSNGLFTFVTVYPFLHDAWKSNDETAIALEMKSGENKNKKHYWKIVTHVSSHDLNAAANAIAKEILLVSAPLFVLLMIGVWWLARAQIRHQEAEKGLIRFKTTLDRTMDCVFMFEPESLKFFYVNQGAVVQVGYNHEELMQMTPVDIKPKYDETEFRKIISPLIKGPNRSIRFNTVHQHKDGQIIPVNIFLQYIQPVNESPRFVAFVHDISEQITLEENLRRTEKMDAMGKLTGGIAHDYNNMLGVIMGYSGLLESELNKQPKLAKYAHEIHHAGKRGAILTKKLLSFSRKNEKNSEAVNIDLNSLLKSQQHMLEKTLTVRIKLVFDLQKDLWPIYLEDSETEDAILNISINAMHAIEGNGKLTMHTCNQTINQMDAQALGLTAGDYVLFNITDTGHGMDKETREKIFEPFFSTKGEQGTGLGLSQVYGFVRRSGGTIKVYSERNKGTRFALYFPRYHETKDKKKLIEENNVEDINGTETILLVDDEPALLNLGSETLTVHGFNVISAENAKNALDVLEHETIDLLITDIIMPEMDGYQLAAIVNEKYPEIKIQLASGFADNRNMTMVDENLQQNILYKPFSSIDLLQRIRKLLDEK